MALFLAAIFSLICFSFYNFIQTMIKRVIELVHVHKLQGPPRKNFLIGNMSGLCNTPDQAFQHLRAYARDYYPAYKFWTLGFSAVNIVNPYDFEIIMSNVKHSRKGIFYDLLEPWLGNGLLLSDGPKWQHRRKILTQSFHFAILQEFIEIFHQETRDFLEVVRQRAALQSHTEITDIISDFTLNSIGKTAMGAGFETTSAQGKLYKLAVHDIGQLVMSRLYKPWLFYKPLKKLDSDYDKERKVTGTLHSFTEGIIAKRRKTFQGEKVEGKKVAMLDLLLLKEDSEHLTSQGILEEVDTFMFEGHDTTASALNFALMLLACHPEVQSKIFTELEEVLRGDPTPSYQKLQRLKYLEQVIKEVLRLYPSVHFISRLLGEDTTLHDGTRLKKDTHVVLYIYDVHRNPRFYRDPETFDPDRFLPEICAERHNFAYVPFSAGSRNCIGQRFAMLELKAILCGVVSEFVLKAVDKPETIVLMLDLVLRTKDPIRVKFVSRNK